MVTITCDVGGTFTDLVVAEETGIRLYKAPTTADDPVDGVLAAIDFAAAEAALERRSFLAGIDTFIHATTRAINAILTGGTARTAFLTTEGHRDILLLREGGRLDPYDNTRRFPRPYVPRALTFEVPERIAATGEIVRPLDEAVAVKIADRLSVSGVEAVAVCLLWSIANPVHELLLGEVLSARLPSVPVTLSHRLNPIVREYRRASSASIDASLKPLMGRYLATLETRLREEGFAGRILVVTSQGGVIGVRAAAEAPIHLVNSGPSMAPIAGRRVAALAAKGADAIVTDSGGTSYDVSLVRRGRVPWTTETWIGPRFGGHMTGFPSVDVKSIGAGGGSIAWLDDDGLLRVGPQSAGAHPGPVCYGRGGTQATVTDCAVVLGLLDPDAFLGGQMRLDPGAARRAVSDIAGPLGIPVEEAALGVLEILTQSMVAAIEEITVKQGIDPSSAVLVAGGGAAGFNSADIARRLGCRIALFPEFGSALSATGAALSDLIFTDGEVRYLRSDVPDLAPAAAILEALAVRAKNFLTANGGAADSAVEFWVEARYPQQTWEIEVPLASSRLTATAFEQVIGDFHAAHHALYGVSDPTSPIELIAWRVRASARLRERGSVRLASRRAGGAKRRRVFLRERGWVELAVHSFASLDDGGPAEGPAIIEAPFTTIFVPPGTTACSGDDSGTVALAAQEETCHG